MSGKKAKETRQEVKSVVQAQQAELEKLPEELRADIEECQARLDNARAVMQQGQAMVRNGGIAVIREEGLLDFLRAKAVKILNPPPKAAPAAPPAQEVEGRA